MIRGSIQLWRLSCFSCIGNFVPATKKRSARMHTRTVVLVQRERLCYSKKDVYQQLRRADIAENRSVHALRKKE